MKNFAEKGFFRNVPSKAEVPSPIYGRAFEKEGKSGNRTDLETKRKAISEMGRTPDNWALT